MADYQRRVYYLSDSTGITVESLGRSVLAQFADVVFNEKTLSFVDNEERLAATVAEIGNAIKNGEAPIIFHTFADDNYAAAIQQTGAFTLNCLAIFTQPLARELGREVLHIRSERFSSERDTDYQRRIDALNYTMYHDDGSSVARFTDADIILVGVSRSGKTPTSLYLALHYGIFTANYPLVEEDLRDDTLPLPLKAHADKLYGLSISPQRLAHIRTERRPGSHYAELERCNQEVNAARRMFDSNGIPYLDVTKRSVEELASKILQEANLPRYL